MTQAKPMPGSPRPNGPIRQFYFRPQCSCGQRMYLGTAADDVCKPGEMVCQNAKCRHEGKVYRAPTVQAQEIYDLRFHERTPTVGVEA